MAADVRQVQRLRVKGLRMSETDLAEFLARATRMQQLINETVAQVTPRIPNARHARGRRDGTLLPAKPSPQKIGAATRRTRNLQNQDAHGRLLTVLVRDLKRHPRVAWLVRMNTGGFL